jgi:hypothetical protein
VSPTACAMPDVSEVSATELTRRGWGLFLAARDFNLAIDSPTPRE